MLIGTAEIRGQSKNNADTSEYGARQSHQEHGTSPYSLGCI